ncbi:elongator complex protein 2-like isoform X2 [Gigantopelta aegis]|uniref:elongator complex protein 2-like isoform X2 n=1 Tax=Gigantopelta aegis TaxID=1735272 RepID=UPI001B88B2B3|nr:elongator complex protein 2-like isoform X2 [Gigantopelta aegis]
MDAVSACYVSAGCNATAHSADWGRNNLISYSSCRAVLICDPEVSSGKVKPAKVLQVLTGHKDCVNCVKWVPSIDHYSPENTLLSGARDKNVVVWKQDPHNTDSYTLEACLSGHSAAVTAVEGIFIPPSPQESSLLIASASSDSSIKIWKRSSDKDCEEIQTIKFGTGFVLDIALIIIPGTNVVLLACGADDHKVHIFVMENNQFVKKMVLLGHEDWVRSLDFMVDDTGDVLLVSSAQDNLIRIWRFSKRDTDINRSLASISDLPLDEDIKMPENIFSYCYNDKEAFCAVSLESVLSGHEGWIYSVRWHPRIKTGEKGDHQPMSLLSASMDKTMMLWMPDPDAGIWVEQVRVGEVGGNTLGFYGGLFGPDGASILAHGYQGAFHHWTRSTEDKKTWNPSVTVGGHFDCVQDIDWDPRDGQFLISTSLDQTTRLHAPWVKSDRQVEWYEIARPQVHGYSMQCLAMLNRYKFVSAADEKVIRVFDAPRNSIEIFCHICKQNLDEQLQREDTQSLPEGASVPALGLSNKAVFQGVKPDLGEDLKMSVHANSQYEVPYFKTVSVQAPPTEENLLQNTLWPETQKLYGHGYEVFSVACDPAGKIVASACKASTAEHSRVILWDTSSWQQVGSLAAATLTVTQIAFSHDGRYLLAVSRDRTWSLFRKHKISDTMFEEIGSVDKKTSSHSRIIWTCAWTYDDKYFMTGSRDKKVMVWQRCDISNRGEGLHVPVFSIAFPDSVTALDIAPVLVNECHLIAVGLDNGMILICKWKPPDNWICCTKLEANAHHMTVKRLKFRPCFGRAGMSDSDPTRWLQFASCGSDHFVRIQNIELDRL